MGEQHRSRIPKSTPGRAFFVESYEVASFCNGPVGNQGPATEVHLLLNIQGSNIPIAMRIKTKEACDQLIAALQFHRGDVWTTP